MKLFVILVTIDQYGERPVQLQMPINPSLPLRFSTGFAYYSLAMGVEEFGVNLYFLQLIFGGVDIPAKFIAVLSINHLGRHITQSCALLLAGGSILALIFVPSGEKPGLGQNPLKEARCFRGHHRLPQAGTPILLPVPLIICVTLSRSLGSLGLISPI